MRTDILDLMRFYESPLGQTVSETLSEKITDAWPQLKNFRVGLFGYGWPYQEAFREAERLLLLAPHEMGAIAGGMKTLKGGAVLTEDLFWPLPDASLDRLVVIHGLEESAAPRQLLREFWRVLTDDGSLIIIAANRRSAWSMVEKTPFAAGRPWTRGQLDRFLRASLFVPTRWNRALFLPPVDVGFLVRAAGVWERTGAFLWPTFSGVTMVEARKEMALPIGSARAERLSAARILRPTVPKASRTLLEAGKGRHKT